MALPTSETTRALEVLASRYREVRDRTEWLCAPLSPEDQTAQSMPDASPAKWHRAHTTWFFETFVLRPCHGTYRPLDERYAYLFNSYYDAVGPQYFRPHRGLVTRPGATAVGEYRAHVDAAMLDLLNGRAPQHAEIPVDTVELGLNHEEQHQELIVTDIKHLLAHNPTGPVYRERAGRPATAPGLLGWQEFPEGICEIGHGGRGFAFDNETPRHKVFVQGFALATRLVTVGEYLEFMADGGYRRPELWLSDGWRLVGERQWQAPMYWLDEGGARRAFTLAGSLGLDSAEPVCHVSHFEADAYARWAGARLPTEAEWEVAATDQPIAGNFMEGGRFHPAPADAGAEGLGQLFGDVWEWTQSAYLPYPGFRPPAGAIGEYNAKFMSGQMVLRGGSCATPRGHIRATYRNFFPPDARWQFTGIRLARDVH